jgi:hypothetical protein
MDDPEFSELLSPIVAFSCEPAWHEAVAGRDEDEVREMLVAILPEAVTAIHQYWQPERDEEKRKGRGVVTESIRFGGGAKRGAGGSSRGGNGKKPKKCYGRPAKR